MTSHVRHPTQLGRYAAIVIDSALEIRSAAFAYVADVTDGGEEVITASQLRGFNYQGQVVPLAGPQGIFKPAAMRLPISIRTAFVPPGRPRPYDDEEVDGYLIYRYQGTDPHYYQNQWLRALSLEGLPLLYLRGVAPGIYHASTAVIVEDRPSDLAVRVALLAVVPEIAEPIGLNLNEAARRHEMALVRRRLGQQSFRLSVLAAYRHQCSLCRLRHAELLDAAHIIPYSEGGSLEIRNGLSMCKIHHAAYDADIVGIRPDHQVEIRADVLDEIDGPMLRHGLQDLHGATLLVPRRPTHHPDRAALERRYERFRSAS